MIFADHSGEREGKIEGVILNLKTTPSIQHRNTRRIRALDSSPQPAYHPHMDTPLPPTPIRPAQSAAELLAARGFMPPHLRGVPGGHPGGSIKPEKGAVGTVIPGGPARAAPKLEALAATMIANPTMGQKELAAHFGVGVTWIWSVIRSDAFQALLATRSEEVYSEALRTVRERMERVAEVGLSKLEAQVEYGAVDPETVLNVVGKMLDRIGFAAAKTVNHNVTGSAVVTHRAEILNNSRQELLERNRMARRKALGLLIEGEAEDGNSNGLSASGADSLGETGGRPAQLPAPEEASRGQSEGGEV